MTKEAPQSLTLVHLGLCIHRIPFSMKLLSLLGSILSRMLRISGSTKCDYLRD